jgi:hypothetical protein
MSPIREWLRAIEKVMAFSSNNLEIRITEALIGCADIEISEGHVVRIPGREIRAKGYRETNEIFVTLSKSPCRALVHKNAIRLSAAAAGIHGPAVASGIAALLLQMNHAKGNVIELMNWLAKGNQSLKRLFIKLIELIVDDDFGDSDLVHVVGPVVAEWALECQVDTVRCCAVRALPLIIRQRAIDNELKGKLLAAFHIASNSELQSLRDAADSAKMLMILDSTELIQRKPRLPSGKALSAGVRQSILVKGIKTAPPKANLTKPPVRRGSISGRKFSVVNGGEAKILSLQGRSAPKSELLSLLT